MKIGVSAFAWTTRFENRHLAILDGLREHGIEALELGLFDPAAFDVTRIRSAFASANVECTICAILPSAVNPIGPDAAARKRAHEYLQRVVETSAELGATRLGGPLYAPIGYAIDRRRNKDEWQWAIEAFQALGPVLDAHQVTLALEPVNRAESLFLNTAADAAALVDAIAHPRIGVLIDTFHANIEEKNTASACLALGARLRHLHISENDRGLIGSGQVDFPAILKALREINYEGILMIEGFGSSSDPTNALGALYADPAVSSEAIAFEGAAYLRKLLATQTA